MTTAQQNTKTTPS